MATIREVSKAAGVSKTTVTRVLREPDKVTAETRERVQKVIAELNYRPNMLSQTFRKQSTETIVVIVPNIANPLFAKIVSGIEKQAQLRGYKLLLGDTQNSKEREEEYLRLVENQLADGVLLLSGYESGDYLIANPHIKAVSIAGVGSKEIPSVGIDNKSAAEAAVTHLFTQGHKNIGLVTGPEANENTISRLDGYLASLQAHNIDFNPNLVFGGDFRFETGKKAADYFVGLGAEAPTAVFSMNDEMAIGLIKGYYDLGLKIPEDVSVMGFDGLDVGRYMAPSLTTISQPAAEMGQQGFDFLLDLIQGNENSQHTIQLKYQLQHHDSVKAII